MIRRIVLSLLWLVLLAKLSEAAKILAIIPVPSYSHQVAYRPLWKALSERGHELVVLTADPMRDPTLTNITEIDLHDAYKLFKKFDFAKLRHKLSWNELMENLVWPIGYDLSEYVFDHPEVRELYKPGSGAKFDVVIAEVLLTPATYTFAHRFNAPLIGASSLGLYSYQYFMYGAPILPSHPSTWEMEDNTGSNLPFWKRLSNFYTLWSNVYKVYTVHMHNHQLVAEKYFGHDIPHVADLEKNMSIVMAYQQEVTSYIRPTVPKVIPFGGSHVLKEPAPLPEDIKAFLDSAKEGFIYVSLGTNVDPAGFPQETKEVFFDVLSNLPCKVLWKFNEQLSRKHDNIFTSSWFPQQSVLAHPKLRAFVYQGGLQSTEEAVHVAVPLVGIPVLGDQDYQVNKMVSLGVARRLELVKLTREEMDEAIRDVLTNKSYKEKMVELRNLSKDRRYDALENLVWWIEFVIRHKGAPHLQCSLTYEPWYQRYDMDIIAFLSIAAFVAASCALVVVYKCLAALFAYAETSSRAKRKIS